MIISPKSIVVKYSNQFKNTHRLCGGEVSLAPCLVRFSQATFMPTVIGGLFSYLVFFWACVGLFFVISFIKTK